MNPETVQQHRQFLNERYNVSMPKKKPSRYEQHQIEKQRENRGIMESVGGIKNQQEAATVPNSNSHMSNSMLSPNQTHTPSAIMSPQRQRQIQQRNRESMYQQQQMLSLDGGGASFRSGDVPQVPNTTRTNNFQHVEQQRNLSKFAYNTLKPSDFKYGLLHLQMQKKLPPQLDLTEIIHSSPSPVQVQKKPLRPAVERAQARIAGDGAMVATEADNFSLWNVKLDLVNETGVTYKDKVRYIHEQEQQLLNESIQSGLHTRRPLSHSVVSINEQQKRYICGSSSDEDEDYRSADDELLHEEDLTAAQPFSPRGSSAQLVEEVVPPPKKDRGYEELMDEFSLHHIIIRRGKLLSSTPEYISYQRSFHYMWGSITTILRMLERLLTRFDVPLAFIDGKKVALLAKNEARKPSVEDLLACIVNYDAVVSKINIPQSKFKGKNGPFFAAVTIQKTWKMYKTRKMYLRLRQQDRHALVIQRFWRLKQGFLDAKQDVQDAFEIGFDQWTRRMQQFKDNWSRIRSQARLLVHLCSWSYEEYQRKSIPKMRLMQMAQMGRLMDLKDPQVEMIFITPYPMSDEALEYTLRLLALSGVKNAEKRLKCVHPENWEFLPQYMSLTDCLLCSPRTLKYIKTMVAGRNAFLIPNISTESELKLAVKLQLPLLGANPQKSLVYSTKSGSKRIFLQSDVNTAPCEYDLYEEADIFLQLSKRIVDHPQYNTWLIKIDHEFSSRGLASLEIDRLKSLSDQGRRELIEELEETNQQDNYLETLRERLYMELREALHKHARIISKYAYPTWESFVRAIQEHGAIIEAVPNEILGYPCVNMFIEPNGEIHVESIQEQLISPEYMAIGAAFPQVTVPSKALHDASRVIAQVLYEKEILGYVSVEFVAWITEDRALKIWAIDLKLRRTESALMHRVFECVTHGETVQEESNDAPPVGTYTSHAHLHHGLSYIYSGIMRHAEFAMWRHEDFFGACRQKDFTYDAQNYRGVVFHLLENLIEGAFGILCIGHSASDAMDLFDKTIVFISNQIENRKSFLDPIGMENSFQCAFQLNQSFQKRREQLQESE
mmetsp:Transcript_6264/g.23539  ORF Transcript_6264/g.23539 Transcript_6264/m.23539 type:complete len:1062 (-) Transcript_6264:5083-8268(-)